MADCVVLNTRAALEGKRIATTPETTAFASPPSSPVVGDLWFPNDSVYVERYTGSAWAPWGPIFPMTPPVNGDFSWVNQGGATVSASKGGIFLYGPKGSSTNHRCRVKTAPSTPYTITAAFLAGVATANYQEAGLLFRESSTGKMVNFKIVYPIGVAVAKVTNETTNLANLSYVGLWNTQPLFWRIADNGTNLIFSWSYDGQNFIEFYSVSRTSHMAGGPNQVGFFVNDESNVVDVGMTLLSWKQA